MVVLDIAYHRNGITGHGFHVVRFNDHHAGGIMIGVVFEAPGHVAVFNQDRLGSGEIAFGVNSFKCEHYEAFLRQAVDEYKAHKFPKARTK